MNFISAAIITFNEEKRIAQCIESLLPVADEILVVDSFSQDRTKEICTSYSKVKWVEQKFLGHIQQKNFAIAQCRFDYVLSVDGDEILSEELQRSIQEVKSYLDHHLAYQFARKNHYIDKFIMHCGWYPDYKIRVFHKGHYHWGGDNPHDTIVPLQKNSVPEQVKTLKGDLLHYSYDSISEHVLQTDKFTSLAQEKLKSKKKHIGLGEIIFRTLFKFVRDYFLKKGYKDGVHGFVICYINALYVLLKYSKLYFERKKIK